MISTVINVIKWCRDQAGNIISRLMFNRPTSVTKEEKLSAEIERRVQLKRGEKSAVGLMWATIIVGGLYFPIPCFIGGAIVVLANLPRDIAKIKQNFVNKYNTCTIEEAIQWEQEDRIMYNDPTLKIDYGQYSTLLPARKQRGVKNSFYSVPHSARGKFNNLIDTHPVKKHDLSILKGMDKTTLELRQLERRIAEQECV